MPNRPTKEFWKHVYPKVYKEYGDKGIAGAVTATAWKRLHAHTKTMYEHARKIREGR
jgi:hypothetical protein